MYKKILVPIDGSKRAEKILPYVENLALKNRTEVILFYSDRLPVICDYEAEEMMLYRKDVAGHTKQTEAYLSVLQERFKEKGINVKACVVNNGSVVKSIVDCAEKENADLVAMTSHGRTGLARAFYGSVAAGVLNLIDRPLLIVRARDDQ